MNKLSKKIIFEQLLKIKIDHSIQISQENLESKINLLFEDCKNLSAEEFVRNCQILRKTELFGKFPPNFKFLEPEEKSEFKKYCEQKNIAIGHAKMELENGTL
jgi:hypothetical protein